MDPGDEISSLVPLRTLDEIAGALGIGRVDLLKIDTEGYEAEVLNGAEAMLGQVQRVILEYHSDALRAEVEGILMRHGFASVLDVPSLEATGAHASYGGRLGLGVLYVRRPGG